ncbi:NYN domain-containing protein [Hydrocarboniphaga sp.]|uniref:NYN domain-containing protein n=1 Tax=Hydrocarboniphaga sp. TaxID=2033016 RepID=UPI003D107E8D
MAEQARLAVLIDADNTTPAIAGALLKEISTFGIASVKRIYGDWTQPNLKGWKDVLVSLSIQPVQQFGYTSGKNSTDGKMIIDAMDLLYTGRFNGFCLVSSDSDFTGLAVRIRESGLTVFGFGERKTPTSLVSACDRFIYLDVLREVEAPEVESAPRAKPTAALKTDKKLIALFRDGIEAIADEEGWAALGGVGQIIGKQAADFDPRNYGYKKLSDLAAAIDVFEVEQRRHEDGRSKGVYIRTRRAAKKR